MGWFSDLFSGSNEVKTKQPAWYTEAAKKAVDLSSRAADIGYVPYQGAEVAAFTPQQKQAFQGVQDRFSAFNTPGATPPDVASTLPTEKDFGGGLRGFSSFGGYQTEMAKLAQMYPGIAEMLKGFSKSPYGPAGAPQPTNAAPGPGSTGMPLVQPPVSGAPPVIPGVPAAISNKKLKKAAAKLAVPVAHNLGFGAGGGNNH